MLWETLAEEVTGSLCGLPPGTVTAAKGMGLLVAGVSSGSDDTETVENNSRNLSDEEKRVVATAVHKVSITVSRDNLTWSRRRCRRVAMALVIGACKLYDGTDLKMAFKDALSNSPRRHRNLRDNVLRGLR